MTAPAAHSSPRRRRRTIALIFVLVVLLTAAAAVTWSVIAADDGSKSARVDEDGFSMSVADARISAPGGVAAEGTVINAESTPVDVSEVAWGGATTLRDGLSVTLEDGAQPQRPVQLQFTIPDDVEIPDGSAVFVLADSPAMEKPELLETQWDPQTRTATATTDHFTEFVPVLIEAAKVVAGFGSALERLVSLRTNQPACFGQDPLDGDAAIKVSKIQGNPMWPCLRLEEGTLSLDLQSSSALIWKVNSIPTPQASAPGTTTGAGLLVNAVHSQSANDEKEALVLTNETASLDYSVSTLPIDVEIEAAPGLMWVHLLGLVLGEFLPADWEALVASSECVSDFAGLIDDDTAYDDILLTGLSCISSVVGGPPGAVLAMVTSAPGALYGFVYGSAAALTMETTEEFRVTLDVPVEQRLPEPGTVPLWNLSIDNLGGSGNEVASWVMDGPTAKLHPASTSQWVGCNGTVADVTYRLDGNYSRLTTTAALRQGVPAGMDAAFEFLVDDVSVHTVTVSEGSPGQAVDLDLTGADRLTVTAATDDQCTDESVGYGSLLGAKVIKVEGAERELGNTAELAGRWAEPVAPSASDDDDLPMVITFNPPGADGAVTGEVEYQERECTMTLTEISRTDTQVTLEQERPEGSSSFCRPEDEVVLERTSNGIVLQLESITRTDRVFLARE